MGTPHEDYLALEKEYAAITEADFIKPLGTHEQIMPYANNLAILVNRHGKDLTDEGIEPTIIKRFSVVLNGFDMAASLRNMAVLGPDGIEVNLRTRTEEAKILKENLLTYGEKAFAQYPELLKKMAEIRSGRGADDLVKDLIDLYALFNANRDKFASLKKFDPTWIDRTATLHVQLGTSVSLKRNPEKVTDQLKLRELQAMTMLFASIKEIRSYGELAWRNKPELLAQLKYSWKSKS